MKVNREAEKIECGKQIKKLVDELNAELVNAFELRLDVDLRKEVADANVRQPVQITVDANEKVHY